MTWFKVDDGFWSHPKTATLSDAAVTLWVRAGSYCCQHLTDGFIKAPAMRLLGDAEAVSELVEADLWHPVDGGWIFHDWSEYQETSETVKKRRESARERQRRARELREQKRNESQDQSRRDIEVTDAVSSLPPTRPDPTFKKKRSPTKPDEAKPKAIEQATAEAAYERVGKAFNFMAVRQIIKWAIHERGDEPRTVEDACVAVHELGKPITKQTVAQYLDGRFGGKALHQRDPKSGMLVER